MLLYGVLWGGDKERSNGEISGQFSGLQAHLTINPNSNTFYLSAAAVGYFYWEWELFLDTHSISSQSTLITLILMGSCRRVTNNYQVRPV